MTGPDRQPTVQQPALSADATSDRPASPWYRSGIPAHLGRARTSTVVLSLLFLAIGALYLNIRPDPPGRTATSDTGTEQPAEPTDAPETTVPEEPTDPASPTDPTTTDPTSTPTATPTGSPEGTTSPEETPDDDDTSPTSEPDEQTGTGTGSPPG